MNAYIVAMLMITNLHFYAEEKGKHYSRIRMSKNTVRKISDRSFLRDVFISELTDELHNLGWHFLEVSDTEFAMIELDRISRWGKISSKRVGELINNDNAIKESWKTISSSRDGLSIPDDGD
jgi:hypothetical protein